MKLGIFGAGGYGRHVYDTAVLQNNEQHCWEEILFVDDIKDEGSYYGTRNLHFSTLKETFDVHEIEFVIALGEPVDREKIYHMIKSEGGYTFGRVIDPSVKVALSATLGVPIILQQGVIVGPNVILDDGVTADEYAAFGHDTHVGAFCHVGVKSTLGGNCIIGKSTFIGLHSAFREGTVVGDYAIVGMGSVVVKDIPQKTVVAGNPAKILKTRDDNTKVFKRS